MFNKLGIEVMFLNIIKATLTILRPNIMMEENMGFMSMLWSEINISSLTAYLQHNSYPASSVTC